MDLLHNLYSSSFNNQLLQKKILTQINFVQLKDKLKLVTAAFTC